MPSTHLLTTVMPSAGMVPSEALSDSSIAATAGRAVTGTTVSLQGVYSGTPISQKGSYYGLRTLMDRGAWRLAISPTNAVDAWQCVYMFEHASNASDWNTLTGFANTSWPAHTPSLGIVREVPVQSTGSVYQKNLSNKKGPVILEVNPLEFSQASLTDQASTALTYINDTATGLLNPGGSDAATVQCAAGQYFGLGAPTNSTAIRCGLDILQVRTAAGDIRSYIITEVVSATTVKVVNLQYRAPTFAANTPVTLRVFQPMVLIGGSDITDDAHSGGDVAGEWARPFVFSMGPSAATANEVPVKPGLFLARSGTTAAFEVGRGTNKASPTESIEVNYSVYGNGGFEALGGRQIVNLLNHRANASRWTTPLTNGDQVSDNLWAIQGSAFYFAWTGTTTGSDTPSLTITDIYAPDLTAGAIADEIIVVIKRDQTVASGTFTVTWPANVLFEGSDGTVPAHSNFTAVYRLLCDGTNWLASRTLYTSGT